MRTHTVHSIHDLQKIVSSGFSDFSRLGHVQALEEQGLLLLNYTERAVQAGRWNFLERISRGLILDRQTGEVVARPFDRFFGWGQGGRTTDAPLVEATRKLDGSLGILYRHRGQHRIATRGSFSSPQARWATAHLQRHALDSVPDHLTLLFEIVAPVARNLIDYGSQEDLVLLAARDRHTGAFVSREETCRLARALGCPVVETVSFDSVADITAAAARIPASEEGWVARFEDGSRFKFKGAAWQALLKQRSRWSQKRVARALQQGSLPALLAGLSVDEQRFVRQVEAQVRQRIQALRDEVEAAWEAAPRENRAAFGAWVNANHPRLRRMMRARMKGQDLTPLILKRLF